MNQATRDSVRALMLIRANRMRGHFHAKLDPLGIGRRATAEELNPRILRLCRGPIWTARSSLITCLGTKRPGCARCWRSCERTYCRPLGVEFPHITERRAGGWVHERIEGPEKEIKIHQ